MKKFILMILLFLSYAGCSDRNKKSIINPTNGEHAENWYTDHRAVSLSNQNNCVECHGIDSKGGISNVSCFSADFNRTSCHADGPFEHTAEWLTTHGSTAKSAPGKLKGFLNCQSCHGQDFSGGHINKSCFTCHGVSAPHSKAPWRSDTSSTHTNTDTNNANICVNCHLNGANSYLKPNPPAPEGTQAGCFNNTLCHSKKEHPSGWNLAMKHGETAINDFSVCSSCHGSDYKGGTSGVSCYKCHQGPGVNHSAASWIVPDHKNSALSSLTMCQRCHGTDYSGGGSKIACTICHIENETKVHMISWYPDVQFNHRAYAKTDGTAKCANVNCHGATLTGVTGSGPSCSSCHGWPFSGTHPSDWSLAVKHGVAAELDFSACKQCHGNDYKGGTVRITCYQCHTGPGINHPAAAWIIPDHKTSAVANITQCQKCHGANYLGGGSHIACNICHMENQTKVHLVSWYPDARFNHSSYAKTNGTTQCANVNCHGTALAGVTGSGPSCSSCHSWPFTLSNCVTCHNTPPSGSTYPNMAGSHAVHIAFTSVNCSSCHTGAGASTNKHINSIADVIFDNVYKAKSGNPAYNSLNITCSKVSCHGGQTTPNWISGSINMNTQCNLCHISGTTEYNSYFSGQHSKHLSAGINCTECHDTNKLPANHFTNLDSSPMTGASLTIISNANYSGGKCTINCHNKNHNNFTW